MRLTPPTQVVFFVSVAIAVIGLLLFLDVFSLGISAFWVMTIAYVVLALGNMLENV